MNTTLKIKDINGNSTNNCGEIENQISKFLSESTALAAVIIIEMCDDTIVALRGEWLNKFNESWGISVADENLNTDWGWDSFNLLLTKDGIRFGVDCGINKGFRVRAVSTKNVDTILGEIAQANEYLNKAIAVTISGYGYYQP